MVLWKKESGKDDAMFVKLMPFEEGDDNSIHCMLNALQIHNGEKSDKSATEFRSSGNGKFQAKCLPEAIELYNKSLRFAIDGSENIALAYANRSACFLHMRKFNECLTDIELARKANYPQRLMPKLNDREAECLKLMNESKPVETKVKPVLSFDPDERFPCMANVLEIRRNDEFGKHIVAKGDIEVGQIILIEEPFVSDATLFNETCCKTCLQFAKNFIPCPNCTDVMFCDVNCMEANNIHKIACCSAYHRIPHATATVESILIAVTAFSTIKDLMKFVETALTTRDSTDSPKSDSIMQTKYCFFLKLLVLPNQWDETNKRIFYLIYSALLQIPEMKRRFDTQPKRRFLMHLIMQHMLTLKANSYAYLGLIQIMNIFSSLFNHSCVPNTRITRLGSQTVGYIVRPVKKGEQLFIRYIGGDVPTEERQSNFRELFEFECTCSKCVPCYKQEDRIQMQSDPNYQLILRFDDKMNSVVKDDTVRSIMKTKCCEFLSKYGRLPWSEENEKVSIIFSKCMNAEFADFGTI